MFNRIEIVATGMALLFLGCISSGVAQENDASLEFPRTINAADGTVVFYTPQIDGWTEYASITARLAVAVTPLGEEEATYGVVEFTADTDPNLEERIVAVENLDISLTSFGVDDASRRKLLDSIVRSTAQDTTHYVPLDVMLTYIAPDKSVPDEKGLSYEPPPIFYSSSPAVLLMVDGELILSVIDETRLEYVVNTNWDLFRYKEKEWYLRYEDRWLKNKNDQLEGSWHWDNRLPGDFDDLPGDSNWEEVRAFIPPAKGEAEEPTVFFSNRPAELIVTDGDPGFRTVGPSGLEYVSDTESDIFRYEHMLYYLVSGRWFSAGQLDGPWAHVAELPVVFASIPIDHAKAHVLAAVPGTEEARLAVLEASIPRTATINRDAGDKVNVLFQGDPVFELIEGTDMQRAANSYDDIILVEEVYYLCQSGVWYRSEVLDGPWTVADMIPAAIYTIPPSSASYHVTHVHVYESDDETVSTGYTSGYLGVSIGFGVAMYGSGWYHPPYYGYPGYPYYYPYPYSYGASSWYNPKTGMYGRSGSVYGPYGGYGRAASYNPQTGAYARGGAVWDRDEIAGRGVAYNPRTGNGVATHRYANEDGAWGESLITHNDKWMQTQSEWDKNSRRTEFETSEGGRGVSQRGEDGNAFLGQSGSGDIYAGKDGNVYRRDDSGWQQHGQDGWAPVEVPDDRAAQIDQARTQIEERAPIQDRPPQDRAQAQAQIQSAFDSGRRSELDRNFDARSSGYERYNDRQNFNNSISRQPQRARSAPRRRR
jgi:hypothetical protein